MERPTQEPTKDKEKVLAGRSREEIIEQLGKIRNSVSDFKKFVPVILTYLHHSCKISKAGQVAEHFPAWTKITNYKEILPNIQGVDIEYTEPPTQHRLHDQTFSPCENSIVNAEVNKLVNKGIITKVDHQAEQIVFNIFLCPKQDGTYQLILNLKKFNEKVVYHHFKMDSIHSIVKLVVQNCFMPSLDMKDAYYSIPIRAVDQKIFTVYLERTNIPIYLLTQWAVSCAP